MTAIADQRQQCPISKLWPTRVGLTGARGRRAEACDESKSISCFKQHRPAWDRAHFGWLRRLRSAIVLQEDVQEPLPPRKTTLYQVGLCPGFSRVASVLPRQLQLLCSRCCLHPPTQRQARSKQQPVRLSSSTKRLAPSISIGRDRSWPGW